MASYEQLLSKYVELRDRKAVIEQRHKEELAKYGEAMGLIEAHLKAHLQKQGLQNVSSSEHVAFLHRSRKATVADTGVFREFIIDNGDFDLADFRPKVEAVETYVTEHNGVAPPGVNFSTAVTLRVQRK